jgi:Caudovirus prohead serine protease
MTLSETNVGLYFRAELEPSDPDVQAIVPKLRRGDLSECSFAFRAGAQTWSEDKTERTVRECVIHRGDVSLVTTAANPSATASLRAEALTLEQRERIAERVGNRVCGPYSGFDLGPVAAPRGRSQIAPRSYIEIAKAKRARLRTSGERRAYTEGEHDTPHGRYTDREIQKLGEEDPPRALKKQNGSGYHYPIVDGRDVVNAVKAYGRAKPNERAGVRAWIVKRARELRVDSHRLPKSWGVIVHKPGPNEPPTSGETSSVGGQSQ